MDRSLMSAFSHNESGLSIAAMDKPWATGSRRTPTAFTSLAPREAKSAMIKDNEEAILIETGRLTARLMHDFKNQLGGLKLYAAFLQKRFAGNAEGMEVAEKIAQGLNEMAEQAAILNKLCRPLELRMAAGDPAAVVEQVISRIEPKTDAKRVKITPDLEAGREPNATMVSFDPRLISEAIEAIILRAVDASAQNGQNGEIVISLSRFDETLRIEIKDNGAPLDDEKRLRFFDPLAGDRLNRTALGLAMARRIIEGHGGQVSAQAGSSSGVAVGTIVEIRLPIADCGLRIAD
jgi:signal transduction histidine kinase